MRAVPTPRNGSIDLLRLAGAAGIVLFHLGLPGGWIGLSALPMFVLLAVYYGADRSPAALAQRLLVPWIIWSGIFGLAKLGQALAAGQAIGHEFAPWMMLTGLSLHLWFLPFVFGFVMLAQLTRRLPEFWLGMLCLTGSVAALWAFNTHPLPTPLPQWCSVLPAAFAGLAMARTGQPLSVLMLLALGGGAAIWMAGWDRGSWQLLIAALMTAGALRVALPTTRFSIWAAQASLCVYLVHPLLIAIALQVMTPGWPVFWGALAGSMTVHFLITRAEGWTPFPAKISLS